MPNVRAPSGGEPVVAKTSTERVMIRSESAVTVRVRVTNSSRKRRLASTSR
jgi:Fe2+ transport system protein FeoA